MRVISIKNFNLRSHRFSGEGYARSKDYQDDSDKQNADYFFDPSTDGQKN